MMSSFLRLIPLNGMKVVLALHVILLYYMVIVNIYHTRHHTGRFSLRSKSNDDNKLVFGSTGARLINTFAISYRDDLRSKLAELVSRKADPRDPELVSLVRELMDPPSEHMVKTVRAVVETPQSREILKCLKNLVGGFFVEAGGLDGERSSNTLFLEQRRKWTGLLIEVDPYFYTQLRGKSRRSWSINACISPYQHPTMMEFKESSGGNGQLISEDQKRKGTKQTRNTKQVPCFSLETMLLALNQTQVDYFSLDVEGFELDVLKTIPFDRINISTLSVEYVHGRNGKRAYESFMLEKGYRVHKDIHLHKSDIALFVDDFIFVKADL